jgi:hypothetical protein
MSAVIVHVIVILGGVDDRPLTDYLTTPAGLAHGPAGVFM